MFRKSATEFQNTSASHANEKGAGWKVKIWEKKRVGISGVNKDTMFELIS